MNSILASPTHFVKPLSTDFFPKKPYCCDDPKMGMVIRPRAVALGKRYIQVNDLYHRAIVVDIDHDDAAGRWVDSVIAPPSWVAIDKRSGRGHLAWVLKIPVCKTQAGRDHPIRYLAAVEYNITRVMGGDPLYRGLLTKNPFHTDWRVWWPGRWDYSLSDLSRGLDLFSPPRGKKERGVGRNCSLFDSVRKWSYQSIYGYQTLSEWEKAVNSAAREMNTFATPLQGGEVAGIARSVARWTWATLKKGVGRDEFIEETHTARDQSIRGRRSGERRREASARRKKEFLAALRDPEMKISEAAQKFGISPWTASKYLREQFHSTTNHCGTTSSDIIVSTLPESGDEPNQVLAPGSRGREEPR